MKKIKLTENMLTNLIKKVISERKQIKEQAHSSETWHNQKKAREQNKYCEGSGDNKNDKYNFGGNYEGQHCRIESTWYDWESETVPHKLNVGASGKWSCKLNACIAAYHRSKGEGWQN